MAIVFHTDGRIEVSSVAEALELQRLMPSRRDAHQPPSNDRPASERKAPAANKSRPQVDTDSPVVAWSQKLTPLQMTVVTRLRKEHRIPRADLVLMVEGGGRSFARFMDGLKASIEEAGLKRADIYEREMEGFGADKRTFYAAGRRLRELPE